MVANGHRLCAEGMGRKGAAHPLGLNSPLSPSQANNMVIHTALRYFRESQGQGRAVPHVVTSNVEHDSIRLPLEQLVKESLAGERGSGREQGGMGLWVFGYSCPEMAQTPDTCPHSCKLGMVAGWY